MITYPSYKSLDEFIDIQRLKSLDTYLTHKINNHILEKEEEYFLNAYTLDEGSPYQPGAREIWLTRPSSSAAEHFEYIYNELERSDLWRATPEASEFSLLMDFIETLPFESTSRIIIIYDDAQTCVPAHRDHTDPEICHEFIWFRTNLKKPFYMLNQDTNQKRYVDSYTAWFDCVNQYHGTDPAEGLSFSLRVDGRFNDRLRKQIPKSKDNLAAVPSLWACAVGRT